MITLATSTFGIILCKGDILSKSVPGPSGKIFFKDEGNGSLPIVFVHSFAGNASHWEDAKNFLAQKRRVIRIELRGHGDSEPPRDGDYRIASMAKDIAAIVDSLQLPKFVLVGHSMGGSVALQYAGENPGRVAGLVLVDTNGDPKEVPETVRNQIKEALHSSAYRETVDGYWDQLLSHSFPKVKKRILEDLRKAPKEMVVRITSELLDYDPNPSLRKYTGPKLAIVISENEDRFSLHRLQGGFSFHLVREAGHWLHLDQPLEFNHILETFLKKL
ncbi:alpha/beta hydrolase [Leptospira langatensis]|uniref:Alpha/beta hydrolase n=1 Tax=Leptospira langatensis TaxID=2484983 RepID=A0A5F1ZQV0_9LEPT|nr:alpha/beta hydrolase [Leptospira langatensis]TGK02731.1 alpha/beta hydrolase [Leptospira langatensis]TGL40065.1 alpha/beta hydrolase [Leptospira langatensis]